MTIKKLYAHDVSKGMEDNLGETEDVPIVYIMNAGKGYL